MLPQPAQRVSDFKKCRNFFVVLCRGNLRLAIFFSHEKQFPDINGIPDSQLFYFHLSAMSFGGGRFRTFRFNHREPRETRNFFCIPPCLLCLTFLLRELQINNIPGSGKRALCCSVRTDKSESRGGGFANPPRAAAGILFIGKSLICLNIRWRQELFQTGSVNWGSPIRKVPSEIHFFRMSAISRALTMLDSGTVGTVSPLILMLPLFSSA